ncbi:hypothetical protein [Alphaproteobacteria bacterium endosymbiont of Tiliacea citrago]|uniref:hypothetical protein n=1 Tax=Alphaproteobacteria bacterium endosymbiont of Tiliacea citrago TaxID=3077944 RepID=UPI00313EAA74
MKIAIIGGKTLLDTVFLNRLSDEIANIDLECYGESGEISFKTKRIAIQDIKKINIEKFEIIINLSNENSFLLDLTKTHNAKAESKKTIYINNIEGTLTINGLKIEEKEEQIIKLPNFSLEPIAKLLSITEINNLTLTINKPIAELGKEAMNQFYYEIKESQFRVIQHNGKKHSEALAFNISFPYPTKTEEENETNQESEEEIEIKKQLNKLTKTKTILNICRVPVNKGSSIITTFETTKEISKQNIINKLESLGLIYAPRSFSTILTENDNVIYFTKIKKTEKTFSIIFMFDSIQIYITNLLNILFKLTTKN